MELEYRDNPQSAIRNPQSEDPQLGLDRRAFLKRAVAAAGLVTGFLESCRTGLAHASGSEIPNPQFEIRNPQSEYRALFEKGKGMAG